MEDDRLWKWTKLSLEWIIFPTAVLILILVVIRLLEINTPLGRFTNWLKESNFLQILEGLSILLALIIFIKAAPDRTKAARDEAWRVISSAQGQEVSTARIQALQYLNSNDNGRLTGLTANKANLAQIDLKGAQLWGANLKEADLTGACLKEANLAGANLQGAILTEAHLQEADLTDADLQNANLMGANLQKAILKDANLLGAHLQTASGLKPTQVTCARDWNLANYDDDFRRQLDEFIEEKSLGQCDRG